jgi:YlmC/YmxH family sporulation protein
MKRINTSDLRELEVINLCGGEKLGYPCDFEIDLDGGRIIAITVRESGGLPFFSKNEEYTIPWCNIECIGEDAILVKIPQNEISSYCCSGKSGKKNKKFK